MSIFQTFAVFFIFFICIGAQQWSPQELAAYRQQYYNWWYNQQRTQQAPQLQFQSAAQPTQAPIGIFGNAQSDSKGNYWHGDDNAKLLLVARSSWP